MYSRLDAVKDWGTLADKANYNPREMAKICRVSLRQLERYCCEKFGVTPRKLANNYRLAKAAEKLAEGDLIKSLAYDLKFKHPSNFSCAFRRKYGVSPRQFLKLKNASLECTAKSPSAPPPPTISHGFGVEPAKSPGPLHSPKFKAKVALAALRANKSLNELAAEFSIPAKRISDWKKQVTTALPEIFAKHLHPLRPRV